MRLQRDSYAPKSCAFDAANVQFLRAHLCKSHPVLQHMLLLVTERLSSLVQMFLPHKTLCPNLTALILLNPWSMLEHP